MNERTPITRRGLLSAAGAVPFLPALPALATCSGPARLPGDDGLPLVGPDELLLVNLEENRLVVDRADALQPVRCALFETAGWPFTLVVSGTARFTRGQVCRELRRLLDILETAPAPLVDRGPEEWPASVLQPDYTDALRERHAAELLATIGALLDLQRREFEEAQP